MNSQIYYCQFHGQYQSSALTGTTGCSQCYQLNWAQQGIGVIGGQITLPLPNPTKHEKIIERLDKIIKLLENLREFEALK